MAEVSYLTELRPIVARRYWMAQRAGDSWRVESVFYRMGSAATWPPCDAFVAYCWERSHCWERSPVNDPEWPEKHSCGIYAAVNGLPLPFASSGTVLLAGRVKLWGVVVQGPGAGGMHHIQCFRAERAYPLYFDQFHAVGSTSFGIPCVTPVSPDTQVAPGWTSDYLLRQLNEVYALA